MVLRLIQLKQSTIKKYPKRVLKLNLLNLKPINRTNPIGAKEAIQPIAVGLYPSGCLCIIIGFKVSVAKPIAANPEIINAVNINENTLETKFLAKAWLLLSVEGFGVVILILVKFLQK